MSGTSALSTRWKGVGQWATLAAHISKLTKRVNAVDVQPSGSGWFDDDGLHIDGVGGDGSGSGVSGDFQVTGGSDTGLYNIAGGYQIVIGVSRTWVAAQTDVAISDGYSVWMVFTYSGGTWSQVIAPSADDNGTQRAICIASVESENVINQHHFGSVEVYQITPCAPVEA